MNAFFAQLGRTVLDRWKLENFSLPAFPALAEAALNELPPAGHVDIEELMHDFLLNDEQPFQSASGFGQPELIVYDNPFFYIQILFWLDGTTDIHQHEFSGAFHVLSGSSLHSHFSFSNVRPVTAHFRLGDLQLKDTRLLQTGDTVPITSGASCIHSLFHLDTPSVTVVIRTHTDPGTGPQFTYLPPHVALDPVHHDALTTRRKQLLDALEHIAHPDYVDLVLAMIAELDFERGFFILQNGIGHLRRLGVWEETWKAFAARHGELAAPLAPTLEEIIRRDGIAALRGSVEDIEHRFFLALLLNVSDRDTLLEMIARRVPGDATATLLRWAGELADSCDDPAWLLDAELPEGIAVSDPRAFLLEFLREWVTGEPAPLLARLPKKDRAALHAAFVRSSWRSLRAPGT